MRARCASGTGTSAPSATATGGWAAMRLAADPALVDCVAVAHPSLLTEADIDGVRVPVQVLAPERDHVFTPELKMHCFRTIPAGGAGV